MCSYRNNTKEEENKMFVKINTKKACLLLLALFCLTEVIEGWLLRKRVLGKFGMVNNNEGYLRANENEPGKFYEINLVIKFQFNNL